ncbi:MAG: AmmeMemoRadiSam system radical SAM enzyme [Candidatus Micrarchaeota archaeon]
MKEAILYRTDGNVVTCSLCNRRCIVQREKRGFCRVRENIEGKLYSLVWGKPCSYAIDAIEKKPFFHFFPGTSAFSIATVGCNFRCSHCQNWRISQNREIEGEEVLPEVVVELAKKSNGIAYTYTEPTIFMEYALDIAKLAKDKGLYNVFVTNGYMTPEAIGCMGDINASRIDLKSIRNRFYREECLAELEPVLESIRLLHKKGHIELINLIIPGKNDSEEELRELSGWIRELGPDIPLHFTAYYPAYKSSAPPTSVKTLELAREIAMEEGLHYVYVGNVPGHPGENTYCYNCGEIVIRREGFSITENRIEKDKRCPLCGKSIKIVDSL